MDNGLSGWSYIYCGQELSGPQEGQEHQGTRECRGSLSYEENMAQEKEMNNGGWKIEVYHNEHDEVVYVNFGPITPDERSELYVAYGFFETEKEAAQAFLEEVSEHPEARYSRTVYERATQLSH